MATLKFRFPEQLIGALLVVFALERSQGVAEMVLVNPGLPMCLLQVQINGVLSAGSNHAHPVGLAAIYEILRRLLRRLLLQVLALLLTVLSFLGGRGPFEPIVVYMVDVLGQLDSEPCGVHSLSAAILVSVVPLHFSTQFQ